jgi:hypothetical protein
MTIPAWIITLIKGILSKEIHFSLFHIDHLHISKTEDNSYNQDNSRVILNPDSVDKKSLRHILRTAEQKGYPLLEKKSSDLIKKIKVVEKQRDINELLNFFESKIPQKDHDALRAALYVRALFKKGVNIDAYKQDIINKWGERGRNISNLCTGGYFETIIKPLYEELYNKANGIQTFGKMYNIIIEEMPIAVFIKSNLRRAEIRRLLEHQIESSKKYGVKEFNVHALGGTTIKNVQEVLEEMRKERKTEFEISHVEQSRHIIYYKITLL